MQYHSILQLGASQTLTVTNAIYMPGCLNGGATCTMQVVSGTTPTNLIYQGTAPNCQVSAATFTYVNCTGGNPIYNFCGLSAKETGSTGIINFFAPGVSGFFIQ
jgi:hypothetical protein